MMHGQTKIMFSSWALLHAGCERNIGHRKVLGIFFHQNMPCGEIDKLLYFCQPAQSACC